MLCFTNNQHSNYRRQHHNLLNYNQEKHLLLCIFLNMAIILFKQKYKFKERCILVSTAALFFVLLLLETKFLTLVQSNSSPESTVIDNSAKNQKYFQNESLQKISKLDLDIFENMLKDIENHLRIYSKILITKEYDIFVAGNNSSLDWEYFHSLESQLIDISRLITTYEKTFTEMANVLKVKQKVHKNEDKMTPKTTDTLFHQSKYKSKKKVERDEQVQESYNFWPSIRRFQTNVTMSNLIRPPGYVKRSGVDIELEPKITKDLWRLADKFKVSHKAQDSSKWDTLNLYVEKDSKYYGKLEAWQKWHNSISRYKLYPDDTHPQIADNVIKDLRQLELVDVHERPSAGTQFKLYYELTNKARALFKAVRYARDQEALPDQYYYSDFERFNAEIAAFHLDRILGFNRVPPATGRLVHMEKDVRDIGTRTMKKNIYYSPAGNLCIEGRCDYFCDFHNLVCGRPYLLEGSLVAYMPSSDVVDRKEWRHPWRRSYTEEKSAKWEHDDKYCDKVRREHPYNEGRRLLDIMDLTVFDFLINNMDRHHYETFAPFGNDTSIIHMDNGKGFGMHSEDEMTCLYPIIQCCLIRYSTLQKLLNFHKGPVTLGQQLKHSLSSEVIVQVLIDPHYAAVDRRLKIILRTVYECIQKLGFQKVIVDDGF